MGVIPSWVCRFFYTRRSVVSYVDNFRLGSADFFLCGSHSVLGLPIFSYGSHSVLGLPIFLYEEVSSIIRR